MPLYLTESDVASLLTMPDAVDAVEAAFRAQGTASDGTANAPRGRFFLPGGVLHQMAAALPSAGVMGTKTYSSFAGGTRFLVQIFSTETGELLAVIEADKLGQMRTGAATGVAARYLAREKVKVAAILGAGWQAQSQVEALKEARPSLEEFRVWSRTPQKRDAFCESLSTRIAGAIFSPCETAEEAARESDIVATATPAREPILKGVWLKPGAFVAAVGANRLTAREIDTETVARASIVVVDDVAQAKIESSELLFAHEARKWDWSRARTLGEIVAGVRPGRTNGEEVTLFKSLGIALEDMAVAAVVYQKARAAGIGREL